MTQFRYRFFTRLISLLVAEAFVLTTLATDLAWGLESSSLSLVGRKNSLSTPGQTLLRPRADKHALDGAFKEVRQQTARDNGLRMVRFGEPIPDTMIAMGLEKGKIGEPKDSIIPQEVSVPKDLAEDELLVAVGAAGLNHTAIHYARGKASPFKKDDPRPFHILGSEGVGIVIAAGEKAGDFAVGNVVLIHGFLVDSRGGVRDLGADAGDGTFAPIVKVKKDLLLRVPEEHLTQFTVAQAAKMNLVPITAIQAARRAGLDSTKHVLIWGLSGSSGTFFAQVAKSLYQAKRVVGITSKEERGKEAVQQGIIDGYVNRIQKDPKKDPEGFVKAAKEANGGELYDLIFESVGGDNVQASLDLLKPGGFLITIGGTDGYLVTFKGRPKPKSVSLEEQMKRLRIGPRNPVLFALNSREETLEAVRVAESLGLSLDRIAILIANDDAKLISLFSEQLGQKGISFRRQVILKDDLGETNIDKALRERFEKIWGERIVPRAIVQDTQLGLFGPLLTASGPFTQIGIVNDTSLETFTIDWPRVFYVQSSLHFADGTAILGTLGGQRDTIQETFQLLLDGKIAIPPRDILTVPSKEIPQRLQEMADGTLPKPHVTALISAESGAMTLAELRNHFFAAADGGKRASYAEVLEKTGIFGPEYDSTILTLDSEAWETMVGEPGKFPYLRGNFPEGYRRKPWFGRKYSGGKTPRDTNALFKEQMTTMGANLSVAYDLLAQRGFDPDSGYQAEAGGSGVSIASLQDYEELWDGIRLDEVTTSHTINQTAPIMLAMYLAVAKKQGVDPKKLRATFQNDVLKEYLSRNTYRLPLDGTLRLWVGMQSYIAEQGLPIKGASVSSYHIREAGSTAVQEVAFMFANALEYLSAARKRGLSVNKIAPTISFFVNLKPDIFEEVAKLRVFRSVWAKLIRELQRQEGVEANPKAQFFTVMAYTGGTDTVRQKPHNNIARIALKLISGPLGGAQAVNAISYDEPYTINTPHPEIIAIDAMQILQVEKGLTQIVDMLGGSYLLEAKTRELEEAVWKELAKIAQKKVYQDALSYMGGPNGEIARSALEEQRAIASGEKKKIGVNVGTEGEALFPVIEEPNPDTTWVGKEQSKNLARLKKERDPEKVKEALEALEKATRDPNENMIPYLIRAVQAYATVGEITNVWVKVFGEADPTEPWQAKGKGTPEVETLTQEMRDFVISQADSFKAGVATEKVTERKYFVAEDLPYVKEMNPQAEKPGEYPYTRGINFEFPKYGVELPPGFAEFSVERAGVLDAAEEVAFALYYIEWAYKAGTLREPAIVLSSGNDFLEGIAKFRAARRVWAKRMREVHRVKDDNMLKLRIHAQTSPATYTTSKFWNNNTRAAWQVLQAYLGQVQTIRVTPFDAPFGEPTELSALAEQMAKDTFDIIQYEVGLGGFIDPLGGSFALEAATDALEQEIVRHLEKLSSFGPSFEDALGYIEKQVNQAERKRKEAIQKGEIPVVGVNVFTEGVDPRPALLREAVPPPVLVAPTFPNLASSDLETRRTAARGFYRLGADLAFGAKEAIGATDKREPIFSLLKGPYTVGLAVTPEHFDAIREAWGNPPLSWVPEDVGVEEFEIVDGDVHLDILRQKEGHADRTIESHIAKRGEGVQQIEFLASDVNSALEAVRQKTEVETRSPRERIRVLLAKPGLDGHDRGIKVIAAELRDAGMEVIYLGLFQTPEAIVEAAIQEDADVIAVSIHSGAHMGYLSQIRNLLKERKALDILVVVGGIIPKEDKEKLQSEEGVPLVYGSDTPVAQMVQDIKNRIAWSSLKDKIRIIQPDKGPREGANHTQVKFFLLTIPGGRRVLTELVQEPHQKFVSDGGVKSGDFLLAGRAKVGEDVIQYPEQILEDPQSDVSSVGEVFSNFVKQEVMPYSEQLDRHELNIEDPIKEKRDPTQEKPSIKDKSAELGMLGITVPEAYGGLDVKKIAKILADLWAWYGDPSFGSLIRVHGGVGTMPIVNFGTEEQKQKYLPKLATGEYVGAYLLTDEAHGSDSLSKGTMLQTKAVLKKDPGGSEYWVLTGNKRFVTNARFSNLFTVFAMTENEKGEWVNSAFIVERDTPGVVVEKDYHKMGLRGSSTADVKFDDVRVPKENLLGKIGQGIEIGMSILNHGRTAVASGSLGGSLRLFEETFKYVTSRPQFGKLLSDFGAVRETLANMVVSLYAQESVVFAVGGLFDGGEPNPSIEAAAAKVFGSESLNRVAYEATQKHGGNGIMDEYAASRFYRDARVMTIFEGANEILLSQVIAPLTLRYLKNNIWGKDLSLFSEWAPVSEGSPVASEIEMVKKAAALVEETAKELDRRFATEDARKAPESQSYFMVFGEMVMELFAMSATVSRTLRRIEKGYGSELEIKMTKVFVIEAMERLQKKTSLILEEGSFEETKLPTHTLLALKHDIASRVIALGKYAPGIQVTQFAKDAGTKTVGELYVDLVTAFGGNAEDAEKDIERRLAAMRKVNPEATREEAVARLAWEYQPRPTEHVFPGDSFSFMYRAATSGAHILLLDLEDAVATTRKEIARDVIMLLIRAFRGELLSSEQVDFIWKNAVINPKDKEAGIEAYFDKVEDKFQLKEAYWFPPEQMILVRPNNLRTKWTAGDYAIVIRGIGHLIDGIYMPKVEGFDKDVEETVRILRAIQREQGWVEGRHKIFVLTELPGAVLNAEKILATAPEVEEAQLGVVDYTAATGGKNAVQLDHFTYMRYPMLHIVEAAKATGKVAGTGITVKLTVEDTAADTEKVVKLGMNRKWSVHPNHLLGMKPYLDQFPPVIRKYREYPELAKMELFKLDRLDQLAQASKPILPPKVFVPRETELVRSVVEVSGDDLVKLQRTLSSEVDMVVIDVASLIGKTHDSKRGKLIEFFEEKETNKLIALQIDLKKPEADEALAELIDSLRHVVSAVIVPSAESVKDVRDADGLLTEIERDKDLEVGALRLGARITNPETVDKEAYPIASASRRLNWLFLDLQGLPKEAPDDPTTKGYNYYHSAFIAATSLADVDAIDAISTADMLEEETLLAANWGFHGKVAESTQIAKINEMMNPQRSGAAPVKPTKESSPEDQKAWAAFVERWKNSIERDLAILKEYAEADQDRKLGAVGFKDPHTGTLEIVDAASARIPYKQMERALKAGVLTEKETEEYFEARKRLLLALRPGGTEGGTRILPGQKLLGNAIAMRGWMVKGFAKTSGDRNRYHLDKAYAEASPRFKGLVAHGLFTVSTVLSSLEQILPDYRLNTITQFKFTAPVRFDDTIVPVFEGLDGEGEVTKVRLSAVNREGKTVFEAEAVLQPRAPNEPYVPVTPTPSDLYWLMNWVQDVTPSFPKQIYDFTDPQSPRVQSVEKEVSGDLIRATQTLFGTTSPELLSQLLAIGTMAMASAESVPGHLLLGGKNLEFGVSIQEGDRLTATATVPAHDDHEQIRRSKDNMPIIPVTLEVKNQRNEIIFKGQVTKMMEPIAAKDGAKREAAITKVLSEKRAFRNLPWLQMFRYDSALSFTKFPNTGTYFVIDGTLLEHDTTQKEFAIILSVLKEGDRKNPIWLVDINGQLGKKTEYLAKLKELYEFVELVPIGAYRSRLDVEEYRGNPIVRIGYQHNEKEMELLDVAIRRTREKEIVSAFSFMSLALGQDPLLESVRIQIGDFLEGIQSTLIIAPTKGYRDAVEDVYKRL